jgi:hypothetical protein
LVEEYVDVWYDDSTESTLSGTLATNTILDAASGPWHITANVIVPSGITLTIEPGTSLFFDAGTSITVNAGGRLLAEGGDYEDLIRFTRTAGSASPWGGVQFSSTLEDNRISYAILEYGETTNGMIGVVNSNILIDHATFDHSGLFRIKSNNSSLTVQNSVFTDMFEPDQAPLTDNSSEQINAIGILSSGHAIIQNNVFGTTHGHNDVIDFSGPVLPGPILQVLNNTFMGGGDECLDLGGDAHIEGNRFMHVHKDVYNTGTGESNAISTGDNLSGQTAQVTVVRNVFYDIDHAVNLKKDTYMFFENNTVVNVADGGSAIKFLIPARDPQGKGAYVDGCIFWDLPMVFEYVDVSEPYDPLFSTDLEMHNSLVQTELCGEIPGTRPMTIMELGEGNICGDPRLADPENKDFSLLSGSPCMETGPNGLDMGAIVVGGASISGEPATITSSTNATISVGGPGIFSFIYQVNSEPWSSEIVIWDPSDVDVSPKNRIIDIELTGLTNGTYDVAVQGKNFAGEWQTDLTESRSWTVDTTLSRVFLNEVLAYNQTAYEFQGTYPDMIELHNDGATTFDLSDMSISDNTLVPRRFVFPGGTQIGSNEYLILYADDNIAAPGIHLGFALDNDGEGVYLYNSLANGGGLVDSLEFGPQIADHSIGRVGHDQEWTLTAATLGQANVAVPCTDVPDSLKINEWLANGDISFNNDFIELYNSASVPVELAGLYLTDHPVARPDKHQIAPLSFIAANGYAVFTADDDESQGPGHLNFKLSATQEMIGLYDTQLHEVDKVIYLGQMVDVSQGRLPDGADTLEYFELPTPGLANKKGSSTEVITTTLIPEAAAKQVLIPGSDIGTAWRTDPNYDTTGWISGTGGVGYENSSGYESYINIDVGAAMVGINETCYVRIPFTLSEDPASYDSLALKMRYDDGFVAYINGLEVQRTSNAPATPVWNSGTSSASTESVGFVEYNISSWLSALQGGENLLAIHGLNYQLTSSDFLISAELDGEVNIIVPEDPNYAMAEAILNDLRITELMYNPPEGLPYDNEDYEFIELRNIGTSTLELEGVRFTNGIDFTFPAYSLTAGNYVVVVKNLAAFQSRYGSGIPVAGVYLANLSNGGEEIILRLPAPFEAAVLRFDYVDSWYPITDGSGYSLVIVNPWAKRYTWSESTSWMQSSQIQGNPGTAN